MTPIKSLPLGATVVTASLNELVRQGGNWGSAIVRGLRKHARCNWGNVCDDDAKINDAALDAGLRILSAYTGPDNVEFWIITEADRSVTTVLLPHDY